MADQVNPTTSQVNGRLWGARAQDWADIQEGVHRPFYDAVFARTNVGSNTKYLDVGCGSGMALQRASELGASVAGLDAAADLLAIAQTRVPGAVIHNGEQESLPFPDNTFDLVTGFNSFQYAGNPKIALREAGRVVKPNGWVAVVVWGEPDGMEAAAIVAALKPFMPPPPAGAPGPFALSGEGALKTFAAESGLRADDIFDVNCPFQYKDVATAVRGLCSAGVAVKAAEFSSNAAVEDAYFQIAKDYIQPDGSVSIGAKFRCMLARNEN